MNSVIASTRSSVFLAMKHIFPDIPINAGTFDPIEVVDPDGTFLRALSQARVGVCRRGQSKDCGGGIRLTQSDSGLAFRCPCGNQR